MEAFVSAVSSAGERFVALGSIEAEPHRLFCFSEIRDEKVQDKLMLVGDPTLDVYMIERQYKDHVEALGVAVAAFDTGSRYGAGQVVPYFFDYNSPPGPKDWSKFLKVRDYMSTDVTGDLSDAEVYARFIGITEAPEAVSVITAWGNGMCLDALLCTENFVYRLRYTNG